MIATIVGHRGFIGSRLRRLLVSRGYGLVLPERNDPRLWREPLGTVFYCAGLTADYRVRPFDTVEAHVSVLARLIKESDFKRLIYLSSTRLYDSLGADTAGEDALLRLDPRNPRNLYDLSKALGENLCITASDGRAGVARLSCIFGDDSSSGGFIADLLGRALINTEITLDSSPNYERDYLHVDEVAQLLLAIAERGTHAIYNVARGKNTRNAEVFEIVSSLTGCIITTTSTATHDAPSVDVSLIRDEFAFRPIPFDQQLTRIVAAQRR